LNAHRRSGFDLTACDHRRKRLRQVTMKRPLQLASAVLVTGALPQQELPALRRNVQSKATRSEPRINVPLQFVYVLVEYLVQRLRIKRAISHHRIDPIYKLRRKALADRSNRDALDFVQHVFAIALDRGLKPEVRVQLLHHLSCAQVAGEKHQALFEVYGGVVSQSQGSLIQNAQ